GPGRAVAAAGGRGRAGNGRFPAGGWIRRAGVRAVLPARGQQRVRAAPARAARGAPVPGPAVPGPPAAVLPDLRVPVVVEPGLHRCRRAGGRGRAGRGRCTIAVSATIHRIPAGGLTMNAMRPLACLLLLIPLLSACSEDSAGAAEVAYEPAGESAQAAPASPPVAPKDMDPVTAQAGPESPFEEDAPPPAREPDVIYVPTPQPVVDAMLELANVGPDDVLYDLGSGDGRIPITAAKRFGIHAVGIDIN